MNSEFRRNTSSAVEPDHFRRLENMYLGAANNQYYRPSIHVEKGAAEIRIEIDPKFFHAADAVHGSVYFKAMDDAAYFAANSLVGDVFVLTASFNIHLLRPVTEGALTARGTVVSATVNLLVADAELTDDRGRLVGTGTGSFMRSKMPLKTVSGYADEK